MDTRLSDRDPLDDVTRDLFLAAVVEVRGEWVGVASNQARIPQSRVSPCVTGLRHPVPSGHEKRHGFLARRRGAISTRGPRAGEPLGCRGFDSKRFSTATLQLLEPRAPPIPHGLVAAYRRRIEQLQNSCTPPCTPFHQQWKDPGRTPENRNPHLALDL